MRNTITLLSITFFLICGMNLNAQIGSKIGKIKKPNIGNNGGNTTTPSSPAVGLTKYDKHMEAARKAEKEGDLGTAYKEYSAALEEKSGDYSASQGKKMVGSEISTNYTNKIDLALKNHECEKVKPYIDTAKSILGKWDSENYHLQQVSKCQNERNTATNAAAADQKARDLQAAIEKMEKGKGYFYSNTQNPNFNESAYNLGDELMLFINLEKTLAQHDKELGIDDELGAYLYLNLKVDGKHIFTSNAYPLESDFHLNENKYMNIPIYTTPKTIEKMDQNILLFTLPNFVTVQQYMYTAINTMKEGKHEVEIEYGLGTKESKKPLGIIGKSKTVIQSTPEKYSQVVKNAPLWMQPLAENEMGKLTVNNANFSVGNGNWAVKYSLPQTPEYYQKKWQKDTYDHGSHLIQVYMDDELISQFQQDFWKENWTNKKEFQMLLLPENDGKIDNGVGFSGLPVLDDNNDIVIPFLDQIYGPELKAGKHKLSIEIRSYDNISTSNSFEQFPLEWQAPLATQDFTFELTEAGRSKMENSYNLVQLSKSKGGEWATKEAFLLKKYRNFSTSSATGTIERVVFTTDWTIHRNAFGVITHRTAKVQVVGNSTKFGCRVTYYEVTEQHDGSKYGNPSMPEGNKLIAFSAQLINTVGVKPIPCSKL